MQALYIIQNKVLKSYDYKHSQLWIIWTRIMFSSYPCACAWLSHFFSIIICCYRCRYLWAGFQPFLVFNNQCGACRRKRRDCLLINYKSRNEEEMLQTKLFPARSVEASKVQPSVWADHPYTCVTRKKLPFFHRCDNTVVGTNHTRVVNVNSHR
jgi:hypothetical protein